MEQELAHSVNATALVLSEAKLSSPEVSTHQELPSESKVMSGYVLPLTLRIKKGIQNMQKGGKIYSFAFRYQAREK